MNKTIMGKIIKYFYIVIIVNLVDCCSNNKTSVYDNETIDDSLNQCYQDNEPTDYSFVYGYLTGNGQFNFNDSITIGFLGAYGQAQVVLGALPLAINDVNTNEGNILSGPIYI